MARVTRVRAMQPGDVSKADPLIVAEVLAAPEVFLGQAAAATPGWEDRYGGVEGVAQLASALGQHLAELRSRAVQVRSVAVHQLRAEGFSLGEIASLVHVTRGTVQKTLKGLM